MTLKQLLENLKTKDVLVTVLDMNDTELCKIYVEGVGLLEDAVEERTEHVGTSQEQQQSRQFLMTPRDRYYFKEGGNPDDITNFTFNAYNKNVADNHF